METTSKFFLRSKTVWGVIIALVCSLIHNRTGVNLSDQVAPLQGSIAGLVAGLVNLAPAIGQFAGVVMVIWGRITAKQPLHILPPKSNGGYFRPGFLLLIAVCCGVVLVGLTLTGCGSNAGTGVSASTPSGVSSTTSTDIEAALPLVRTGSGVATGAVLDFAVKQASTRTRLANEMYAAASSIYSLSGGSFPTPAQFQSNILAFGGSQADANYAQFSTAIAGLYSAYYPKLVTGDTKTATDLLNAIAGGIEDATASYVSTPVPTASSSSGAIIIYRDGAAVARLAHNQEAEGSIPSPGTFGVVSF